MPIVKWAACWHIAQKWFRATRHLVSSHGPFPTPALLLLTQYDLLCYCLLNSLKYIKQNMLTFLKQCAKKLSKYSTHEEIVYTVYRIARCSHSQLKYNFGLITNSCFNTGTHILHTAKIIQYFIYYCHYATELYECFAIFFQMSCGRHDAWLLRAKLWHMINNDSNKEWVLFKFISVTTKHTGWDHVTPSQTLPCSRDYSLSHCVWQL